MRAASKTSRDAHAEHSDGTGQQELSGFESRCLLKRICECHEVVCLAILSAGAADEKAGGLMLICEALKAAESAIVRAESLAVQQLQ